MLPRLVFLCNFLFSDCLTRLDIEVNIHMLSHLVFLCDLYVLNSGKHALDVVFYQRNNHFVFDLSLSRSFDDFKNTFE